MIVCTGKSLSEALIFASTNPQYDDRWSIELQVQYIHENFKLKPGETMLLTEIISDIQNNFCTQHVSHVLQKEELLKKIYVPLQVSLSLLGSFSLNFKPAQGLCNFIFAFI